MSHPPPVTPMPSPDRPPMVVTAEEVSTGDPSVWRPGSYIEWEARERTRTFLATWAEQMTHEQKLRTAGARTIFWLIGLQVAGAFGLVVAQGLGWLTLDAGLLKVLLPSVFAEVFGLGFVVTKYLFSQSLRHGLDTLVQGAKDAD